MKKNWQWLICILFLGFACLLPTETAMAETEYIYKFHEDEQAYYIASIDGEIDEEITLPTAYEGYPVVGLEDGAIGYQSKLETVIVPKGYTVLGERAFEQCDSLKKVIINAEIETLKKEIFSQCTSLNTLVLPTTLKKIEWHAFYKTGFKTFALPEGVTAIVEATFADCDNLETLTIPKSVTSIEEYAIRDCEKLKKVTVKAKIKTLESNTFYMCKNLETVILPSSLKKIKGSAFYGSGLSYITIPKNVTTIEENAFSHLDELKKVTIKAKIKTLQPYTFYGCDKLEKVVFPSTLKTIKEFAFYGAGIKTITIPKTVKKVESNAFASCKNLYRITFEGNDVELDGYIASDTQAIKATIIADKGSDAYRYAKEWGYLTSESTKFKVELNGTKMFVGEKKQLSTYNNPYPVKWTSSNKKVVAIDKDGYITAKKKGSATITAKINGKKYKYKIKVVKRTEKNVLDIIWSNYVTKDMSDYEKVVAANSWFCQNVEYDYDNYIKGTVSGISYTTKGVFEKGLAVCDGYANAFKKIMEHYGIPVMKVIGTSHRNVPHAWNLVKIGTRWYHVDTTGNSSFSAIVKATYLLCSDERMAEKDRWVKADYPKVSAKAPDTTITTVNKNGTKISTLEKTLKVGKSTTLKVTGTKKKVTWSSSNKKIVTVNSKGKITAKKAGTAKIYCKVGGKKYVVKVTVTK